MFFFANNLFYIPHASRVTKGARKDRWPTALPSAFSVLVYKLHIEAGDKWKENRKKLA